MSRQRPPNENYHHNVPSSRGGTGQSCNLSPVRMRRHADFHEEWAANKPPCALLRQMAIRSLGLPGEKSLPPGALKELLFLLTPKDWPELYLPAATVWKHKVPKVSSTQREDARRNTKRHLQQEKDDVYKTIRALVHGTRYPSEWDGEEDILRNALLFFETDLPHEAMQKFLKETHAGELSWVKAMRRDVRENLLSVLSGVQPITVYSDDKRKVENTLGWHKQYLHHALHMEDDR